MGKGHPVMPFPFAAQVQGQPAALAMFIITNIVKQT